MQSSFHNHKEIMIICDSHSYSERNNPSTIVNKQIVKSLESGCVESLKNSEVDEQILAQYRTICEQSSGDTNSSIPSMDNTSIDEEEESFHYIDSLSYEEIFEKSKRKSQAEERENHEYISGWDKMNKTEVEWGERCYPSGRLPLVSLEYKKLSCAATLNKGMKNEKKDTISEKNKKFWSFSWLNGVCCAMQDTYPHSVEETIENYLDPLCSDNEQKTTSQQVDNEYKRLRDVNLCHYISCGQSCNGEETVLHEIPLSQQTIVNRTIENFLGINEVWCNIWQTHFIEEGATPSSCGEGAQSSIKNRACNMNLRTQRIRELKVNLDPFELDHMETDKHIRISRINKERSASMNKNIHSYSGKSPKPTSIVTCFTDTDIFPNKAVCDEGNCYNTKDEENESLCYDSDPGVESLFRQTTKMKQVTPSPSKGGKRSELDTDAFKVLNTKFKFIWHEKRTKNNKNTPIAVNAWIELGSQLRSSLIQPKFVWQPMLAHKQERNVTCNLNTHELYFLDLLDISKILLLQNDDKNRFPFAKQSCSFIIESYGKKLIFQTDSEDERNRIMHGLKVIVAKLGSKIIVGDESVLQEFFTPVGAGVPGMIPSFVR